MNKLRLPRRLKRLVRMLRPRSRGIRVSRSVLRLIWAADAAREAGDWRAAASAYHAALAKAPRLPHIWVQYGHMLRETACRDEARVAYQRAIALEPHLRDPHLQLVALARAAGDRERTLTHALAAFRLDPDDAHGQIMVLQALSGTEPDHTELLVEVADRIGLPAPVIVEPASAPGTIQLDVADLVRHFAHSRLPSGLQRVEIEVARAALATGRPRVALCCWSTPAAAWKPFSNESFLTLVDAASSDLDERGWHHLLASTMHALATAPSLAFPRLTTLVNLGMAWGDSLYHPAVAREKERSDLRFAAIACDVIPLLRSADVPQDIVAACGEWLDALAETADAVIAISAATRDDLIAVSAARGHPLDADRVGVVPLDATFASGTTGPGDVLSRYGLRAREYALYVSTIEPRKNHLAAFEAWRLLAASDDGRLPVLVCVGKMGWRSREVIAALVADAGLAQRVRLLEGVPDEDLDRLYDECALVFYPSLQEGWGLPITEALARGKVPVIGSNSSLPEAGGRFAVYFDASSPADMAATMAPLIRDPAMLAAREAMIRDHFRPRDWAAVASDMIAVATGAPRAADPRDVTVPSSP